MDRSFRQKLLLAILFAAAFAFIEASVVVYLRKIYYPEGFRFPLVRHYDYILIIEIIREFATIILMLSAGILLSRRFWWEGFGYFLAVFGVWDILFYAFLKLTINWPASLLDWDVLFLIPVPWIGPVIAPVTLSAIMFIAGAGLASLGGRGLNPRPGALHWLMVLAGSVIVLYSFTSDPAAGFREQMPEPYRWELLVAGELLLASAYALLHRKTLSGGRRK